MEKRVAIGRTIGVHEAIDSALGYAHVVIIELHDDINERAVFFSYGRKIADGGAKMSSEALGDISREARRRPAGEARLAYLRERLVVSREECKIPDPLPEAKPPAKKKPSD